MRGCVRDAGGQAIAGAVVLIECETNASLTGSARTAADGRYDISGLDAPSAQVLRCLPSTCDTVLAVVPLRLQDGETRVVDIGGEMAASLCGTVRVQGEPQRNAQLWIEATGGELSLRCATRDDGGFAFAGLPPGRYELSAYAGGARNLHGVRAVEVGEAAQRCDFDFGRAIRGVVELVPPTGGSLANAEVVARSREVEGASQRVDVGEDGQFELLVGEPGIYDVEVDGHGNLVTLNRREVDLRTATAVDGIVLQVARDPHEGRIELRCVDAATGAPASGWIRCNRFSVGSGASVLEDGRYVEEGANLGRYRFEVITDEHRPAVVELELTPFEPRVERRVALEPAQAVRVTQVVSASNAHRAGIQAGDLLRRYGGTPIHSVAALHAATGAAVGRVTIVVERDGVELALTADAGLLGIQAENL